MLLACAAQAKSIPNLSRSYIGVVQADPTRLDGTDSTVPMNRKVML